MNQTINPYPRTAVIEEIQVAGFSNPASLIERIMLEARKPQQSTIFYLNIHVANMAKSHPRLKSILKEADVIYCDGVGIVVAARMLGQHIPTRLTAADWVLEMLERFSAHDLTVFLLGGAPGIAERACQVVEAHIPHHTVIGHHHGFIMEDAHLERNAIDTINRVRPDILIVGCGVPLQEYWIDAHRQELDVPVLYSVGALMDFISGNVARCPQWMADMGFDWLYRFLLEPRRLFGRYVVGNPWFMGRMILAMSKRQLNAPLLKVGGNRLRDRPPP